MEQLSVLKTGEVKASVGSNPTLSVPENTQDSSPRLGSFFLPEAFWTSLLRLSSRHLA